MTKQVAVSQLSLGNPRHFYKSRKKAKQPLALLGPRPEPSRFKKRTLSNEEIDEIRNLRAEGHTLRKLREKSGLSIGTVRRILGY